MARLYELTADYQAVLDMMDNPDIDPQMIADTLEGIEGEIEQKADGYAMVMREAAASAEWLGAEIKRLQARKKSLDSNIARMSETLKDAMNAVGKRSIKTERFTFTVQLNPPKVVLDDTSAIPERYLLPQEPKVDAKTILEELKEGATLPFAHLEQGEGLRIR
jgi:hypothetical protein